MHRRGRWVTIGVLAAGIALPAGASAGTGVSAPSPECMPRSAPIAQGPATLVSQTVVPGTGGQLLHVVLDSPAMGTDMNNYVLLPPGYDPSGATHYPVLYLLHGADGTYTNWINLGNAQNTIDSAVSSGEVRPFITVMPDGGLWGFYSDWYGADLDGSTRNPPPAYATYDIDELIPWIDANFPTVPDRQDRAIAGLSMGGFGAMSYAARYPDLFGVAGSFSGAVDTDLWYPAGGEILNAISSAFTSGPPEECVWGDPITDDVNWRDVDPTYLASNLRNTALFVASGNGSDGPYDNASNPGTYAAAAAESYIWEMNQKFVEALDADGVPYTSYFYGAGTHSWPYWQRDLERFLPFMQKGLAQANETPPSVPFSYRSDQTSFKVWGWQFSTDRPATEFTYLDDVNTEGLDAVGSGTMTVTTPPLYQPDTNYTVTVMDSSASVQSEASAIAGNPTATSSRTTRTVESNAAGMLRFPIELGTAHSVQQMHFSSSGIPPSLWTHARVTIQPEG